MDISKRKRTILAAVVVLHTNSGDPVGSHILNNFLNELSVSSATLRNEMAELTSIGLLEQPHTSAGRVPTPLGYRYYVDNLMLIYPPRDDEKAAIDSVIASLDSDPNKAVEAAARELAKLSGLGVFASTPKGTEHLVHFQVLRVGRYSVAVLGVTDAGSVKSRVCRVGEELNDNDIAALEAIFNDHLTFVSPQDVTPMLIRQINAMLDESASKLTPVVSSALSMVKHAADVFVFTAGQQNLLKYHEFDDNIKELLELFGNDETISNILNDGSDSDINVYVGDELERYGHSNLGIITARYRSMNGLTGGIGIAGPIRVNYAYIIPRLRYFCDRLGEMLRNDSAAI